MTNVRLAQATREARAETSLPTRRTLLTGLGTTLALGTLTACGPAKEQVHITAAGDEHTNEPADVDVNQVLDAIEAERGISLSLAVYNHTTDKLFLHKGDIWTYEASIVKVPICLTLLRKAAFEGRPLTDDEKALVEASLTYSDNLSTIEIFRSVGSGDAFDTTQSAESVNKTYELLGLTHTTMGQTWGDNQTWAEDQLHIMRAIVDTVDWVNAEDAQFLLERLIPLDWSQTWGVGALNNHESPQGVIYDVSVKNGWIQEDTGLWHINSVGVVRTDQATYSIAYLSKGFEDQTIGYEVATQAITAYFDKAG